MTCELEVEDFLINIVNTINIITISSTARLVTAQWTENSGKDGTVTTALSVFIKHTKHRL